MLRFLRRLLDRSKSPDLSHWPHPLRDADERHLTAYAIGIANVTLPARLPEVVDLLRSASAGDYFARMSRREPLMTPDDLQSFGLNRRLKLSAAFFLLLTPEAQKDPRAAERKLVRHMIAAIGNRRRLNELVQTFGPKQVVEFVLDERTCCMQSRSFVGKTWAAVAPDLPLPGCSAESCLCDHCAVIEF